MTTFEAFGPILRSRYLIFGAAALAGLCSWFIMRSCNEEHIIQRRLNKLARLVEKHGEEKPLTTLNRMRQIGDFFAPFVQIDLPEAFSSPTDRRDILAAIQNARGSVNRLRIKIRDQVVTLERSAEEARTRFVAEAAIEIHGEHVREIRELEIIWRFTNGAWVVYAISPVDSIRRVPLSDTP